MNFLMFDQFSLLHFASGVIAYFWGIPFWHWFVAHMIFEYAENTQEFIYWLNKINIWPGGKEGPDAFINNIGDQISSTIGWLAAYQLDKIGKENGWHRIVKD